MASDKVAPAALTPAQLAKIADVEVADIEAAVAAGAPANADGTLHLVQFAAWLHQQLRQSQHGS